MIKPYRQLDIVSEIKAFFKLSQPKPEIIEVNPKDSEKLKVHLAQMTYMFNMI